MFRRLTSPDDAPPATLIAERPTRRKLFERPQLTTYEPAPAPQPVRLAPAPVQAALEARRKPQACRSRQATGRPGAYFNLLAPHRRPRTQRAAVLFKRPLMALRSLHPTKPGRQPSTELLDRYQEGTVTDDERRSKSLLIE